MARNRNTGNFAGLYGGDARGLYSLSAHRNMMIYGKPPRRWPKVLLVIVIILIIVVCILQFACGFPFGKGDTSEQEQTAEEQTAQDQVSADEEQAAADLAEQEAELGTYQEGLNVQIQISAVGDCTLGTDVDLDESTNFTSVYDAQDAGYFFDEVYPYTASDDLTIANLEGPLTSSDDIIEKAFNFKGPAEYADILVQGSVEAVNLANNHSFDYGTTGYEDTKANLEDYGVTSFGYDRVNTYEVEGITVGLFGINVDSDADEAEDDMDTMKADIAELKEAGCALIIGVFHWGTESEYAADDQQVEFAHAAIDEGCDLVIGGHPHVLQGVEVYNDRYICYSMGNFVFGGNSNPKDWDTMIFQQTFTFENGWLVMDDEDLAEADIIPCSLSSSSSINNYQPVPLTGDDAAEVIEKVNDMSADLEDAGVEFDTELDGNGRAQAVL